MDEYDVSLIAKEAVHNARKLLVRGAHENEVALLMTRGILYKLGGIIHGDFQINYKMSSGSSIIRYHGLDVYIADYHTDDEEEICVPVIRCSIRNVHFPIQDGDYFLFDEYQTLFRSNDGERVYDTGIRVCQECQYEAGDVPFMYNDYYYTYVPQYCSSQDRSGYSFTFSPPTYLEWPTVKKQEEPELQATPELDEFIEQFRRHTE